MEIGISSPGQLDKVLPCCSPAYSRFATCLLSANHRGLVFAMSSAQVSLCRVGIFMVYSGHAASWCRRRVSIPSLPSFVLSGGPLLLWLQLSLC